MKIVQFFEDDRGSLSMTRLLAFASFFPASSVLAVIHSETALMYYLTAYALQSVGSKWMDTKMVSAQNAVRKSANK